MRSYKLGTERSAEFLGASEVISTVTDHLWKDRMTSTLGDNNKYCCCCLNPLQSKVPKQHQRQNKHNNERLKFCYQCGVCIHGGPDNPQNQEGSVCGISTCIEIVCPIIRCFRMILPLLASLQVQDGRPILGTRSAVSPIWRDVRGSFCMSP